MQTSIILSMSDINHIETGDANISQFESYIIQQQSITIDLATYFDCWKYNCLLQNVHLSDTGAKGTRYKLDTFQYK